MQSTPCAVGEHVPHAAVQVGIALVGMSSLLSGEGSAQVAVSPEQMLLGMGLIVASQVPHRCLPPSPPSSDMKFSLVPCLT